jgi:hypothetical protein
MAIAKTHPDDPIVLEFFGTAINKREMNHRRGSAAV